MEVLNTIGGIASIVSLIISIIAYRKASAISTQIGTVGHQNTIVGRDIHVQR